MFQQPLVPHRLFFALRPPKVRARQIASAAHWFATTGDAVAADRLHVTSFILDDLHRVDSALVEQLSRVGAALTLAPFDVVLDQVVGGPRSVALRPSGRNDGLATLHRRLTELARAAGVTQRKDYRFSPHLTLGYRTGEPFQQRVAPVGWRAKELLLIHSLLGRTRHEVVGRWLLDGDGRQGSGQLGLF